MTWIRMNSLCNTSTKYLLPFFVDFKYSFKKYFLSPYYAPGIALGNMNTTGTNCASFPRVPISVNDPTIQPDS